MDIATCPNCGQQVIGQTGGAYEVCPSCGTAVQVGTGPGKFPKWAIWTIVGGSVGVVLLIVIISLIPSSSDSSKKSRGGSALIDEDFDTANKARILSLKAQADDLGSQGKLDEARATYRQILEISANQKVRDRELLAAIMSARAAHDRLGREGAYSPEIKPATPPATSNMPKDKPLLERRPATAPADALRDEDIEQALRRGVAWLKAQRRGGRFSTEASSGRAAAALGRDALATYALLQAGYAIKDPDLTSTAEFATALLDGLRAGMPDDHYATYTRGLRALALGLYGRAADRKVLEEDVRWLIAATPDGAYGYAARKGAGDRWDNSNSQYGLLGVWAGADRGIAVPEEYWKLVQTHWTNTRLKDERWGYERNGDATYSMTCAGLASLFVAIDNGAGSRTAGALGADPYPKVVTDALAWLESGDTSVSLGLNHAWSAGYNLYGLERVGLATGFKYFGGHDWYREISRRIVDDQRPDGSWLGLKEKMLAPQGDYDAAIVETSYFLLFLSRGRHPILMNKLRYDGPWANRPRDLANLARYSGDIIERPLNWQVVSVESDWTDWTDSPIIYLSGHEAPKLTDGQIEKIGRFVRAGGMLFTNADGDSEAFSQFAATLAGRLFPEYPLKELPRGHTLFNVVARIPLPPRVAAVNNGARLLMIHSPVDLAAAWQTRSETINRNRFELGLNIFVYAAGKQDLRNRLTSPYIAMPAGKPLWTVPMARLKYSGNWDPEPAAVERLAAGMMRSTSWRIEPAVVPLADLTNKSAPLAMLTGTGEYAPTLGEIDALRAFVDGGGVVVIDSAGGGDSFADSARRLLAQAFEGKSLVPITADHPILRAPVEGMDDLTRPVYRAYNLHRRSAMGSTAEPPIGDALQILESGKGAVVFCPRDITTALVGTHTWGILGFAPPYAMSLMKNIILWTEDRK